MPEGSGSSRAGISYSYFGTKNVTSTSLKFVGFSSQESGGSVRVCMLGHKGGH